jgi:hypothetical protein
MVDLRKNKDLEAAAPGVDLPEIRVIPFVAELDEPRKVSPHGFLISRARLRVRVPPRVRISLAGRSGIVSAVEAVRLHGHD